MRVSGLMKNSGGAIIPFRNGFVALELFLPFGAMSANTIMKKLLWEY
jgi:hypothetical protein